MRPPLRADVARRPRAAASRRGRGNARPPAGRTTCGRGPSSPARSRRCRSPRSMPSPQPSMESISALVKSISSVNPAAARAPRPQRQRHALDPDLAALAGRPVERVSSRSAARWPSSRSCRSSDVTGGSSRSANGGSSNETSARSSRDPRARGRAPPARTPMASMSVPATIAVGRARGRAARAPWRARPASVDSRSPVRTYSGGSGSSRAPDREMERLDPLARGRPDGRRGERPAVGRAEVGDAPVTVRLAPDARPAA